MRYFTQYWKNDIWNYNFENDYKYDLVDHSASNLFTKRGVEIGDAIYIITVIKGRLYACAKLIVGKICGQNEATIALEVSSEKLWQADEHILASASTSPHWDLVIPLEITKRLKFITGEEVRQLSFITPNKLDPQTLRGIRQLTPESATKLDTLLGRVKNIPTFEPQESNHKMIEFWKGDLEEDTEESQYESGYEGNPKLRFVTYYERNSENRRQAIKIHGYDCKGCSMNFESTYGSHGQGFIHIHHIKPVAQFGNPQRVNPETDLIPLCPNCHAMVHKNKNRTLSLEELQALIERSKATKNAKE